MALAATFAAAFICISSAHAAECSISYTVWSSLQFANTGQSGNGGFVRLFNSDELYYGHISTVPGGTISVALHDVTPGSCTFGANVADLLVPDAANPFGRAQGASATVDYSTGVYAGNRATEQGGTIRVESHPASTPGDDVIYYRPPSAAFSGTDKFTLDDGDNTTGQIEITINVTAPPAPTVTALSPTSGPPAGGTSVVITGTNFTDATAVAFGGTAATSYTVNSATQITATAPAGSEGVVNVRVMRGSISATSAANQYRYVSPPTIAAAFSPTSVSQTGSSTLTLTVTNPNASTQLTGVAIAAQALPTNLTGGTLGGTCTGGSFSGNALSLSGQTLNAGQSCTVTLSVSSSVASTYSYTTGAVSASGPVSLSGSTAGTPTGLTVTLAPVLGVAMTHSGNGVRGSTLNYTITPSATAAATTGTLTLVASVPTGMTLSSLSGTGWTCSVPTATCTSSTSIAAGNSGNAVTMTVSIAADAADSLQPSAQLSGGGAGNTPTATDTTAIKSLAPTGAASVNPATIGAGGTSTVTITLTNPNTGAALTSVTTASALPANVTVAATPNASTSCGGTVGATAGGSLVTLSGASIAANGNCSFSFDITASAAGSYSILAGSPSAANISTGGGSSTSATLTVNAAPTITNISPAEGKTAGAASVTITGTNFSATDNSVTFGGVAGNVTANGTTSITVTPPDHAAGLVDVVVTNNTLGTSKTQTNGYRYIAPPMLAAAFSPTSVANGADTTLTLTLTNPNGVQLNGVAVAGAGLPSGLTGRVASLATTCGGTPGFSGNALSYSGGTLAAGASCTVSVDAFATAPGTYSYTSGAITATGTASTSMTLTGSAASTATGVTVAASTNADLSNLVLSQGSLSPAFASGTTSYAASVANGVSTLTATPTVAGPTGTTLTVNGTPVTSGAASGAIALAVGTNTITILVTAQDGTTTKIYTVTVTRLPPAPTVTNIAPAAGPTAGGTTVVITGTDLNNATAVAFGGNPATGFTVDGATQITATSPAGSGTVDVRVTTPSGMSATSAADQFTYVAAPTITSVTPNSGPAGGSTAVTVNGTNLTGATVTVAGVSVTPSSNDGSNIQLTAPPHAAGAFNVVVTTVGGSASSAFTYAAPTVLPTTLPAPTVGVAYSQALTASDGIAPYSFSATGALPTGLTLAADGTLSGTPTAGGSFTFTVIATDSAGIAGTRGYTLTAGAPTIAITPATLTGPVAGSSYSATLTAAGGSGPYTFGVTGGTLPAGLALSSGGTLSGTPTAAGAFSFTVTATDSSTGAGPYTGARLYSGTVAAPTIAVAPATLADGTVGVAYSGAATASGGTAPYTFTSTGTLPPGVSLATNGALSGTPTTAGTYNFTLTATDSTTGTGAPFTASRAYTVAIGAGAQTISFTSTAPGSAAAGGATYTPTATATSGLAVSFTLDASSTGCSLAGGVVSFTAPGACVINANQAGDTNWSAAAQVQQSFAVGKGAPTVAVTSPGTIVLANPVTYTATLAGGVSPTGTISFQDGGTGIAGCLARPLSSGQATCTTTPASGGTHSITAVYSGDANNNTSTSPAYSQQVSTVAPTVTALSPTAGSTAGGTSVTLTGTNLTGATNVSFGGASATFTVDSDTSITATAPAHSGGGVNVIVTTPSGASAAGAGNAFTYLAAPVVGAPAEGSTIADNTPTVSGSGAVPGATVNVNISGPDVRSGVLAADGSGNWNFTTGVPMADGAYAIVVDQQVSGQSSPPSATRHFTIDTTAPAAPAVTTPANGSTVGQSPAISGTAEANSTVTVTIDGATAGTTTTTSGGSWSFASSLTATGPHTVRATATDAAGNASPASATNNFTVAALPAISNIAPASGPVAGGNSVTITGTNFLSATSVDFGATPATAFTIVDATTITATVPAGSGTVGVTVTNPGGASAPLSYSYFGAPTVTSLSPNSGSTAGGTSVTIIGTNLAGATAVSFGGTPASYTVNSPTTIAATAPAGTGTGNVVVTTPGGTSPVGPGNLYAWIPPAPAITAPTGGATFTATTPTISGTGADGATVTIRIDGADAGTATVAGGNWSITPAALSDGAHTLDARQTLAGQTSANSAALSFTTDATAPAAPSINLPAANAATSDDTPAIGGTAEGNATITVTIDGATAGTTTADSSGNWSFTPGTTLANGAHTVSATAKDALGNTSAPSASRSFTVDTAAPAAPVVLTPANGANTAAAVSFTGTAEANSTVTILLDGATAGTTTAGGGGSWSFAATAGAGPHAVSATATDAAGNVSPASASSSFTVVANAAVTSVAPNQGPLGGGTVVTITGTNFVSVTSVAFGGVAATGIATVNGTTITATAPAHAAGAVDVTVTAIGGGGTLPGGYTYVGAPAGSGLANVGVPYGTAQAIDLSAAVTGSFTSVAIATPPTHGTLSLAGNIATYTPATGYFGPDSFTFTATGVGGTSPPVTVSLTVANPPAPVVANKAGVAVPYGSGGTAIDLAASITGVHTSLAVATPPAHGTTSVAGDVVTYTPAAGYFGADGFTYTATGAGGTSAPATVSLTVGNPPAPVAANKTDVAVPYASTGTAIDLAASVTGVHTALAVVTAPTHGTAVVAGDVITYAPAAGYFGTDSFTYTATGPGGTSAPATVSLAVAVPPAPVAADKSDVAVPWASTGAAIDLAPSITGVHTATAIVTAPTHGTATLAGDVATYIPAAGYFGADSFTYTATGPGGTSAPATVTLTVGNPPAPVVADKSDVAVPFASTGTAIDLAQSITGIHTALAVATPPAHGSVTIDGDIATYTPASGYFGADSFTVTATGPGGTSAPATVSITVAAPPPPTVEPTETSTPGSTTGGGDNSARVNLADLVSGEFDRFVITREPQHGTVVLTGGQTAQQLSRAATPVVAVYTPNPGYFGPDSFEFAAVGPGGTSPPATVSIEVQGTAPVAQAKTASAGDAQTVSIELTEGAVGGPFTGANVVSVSPQGSATAAIVAGGTTTAPTYRLDVTPAAHFNGSVVVTYTLANAFGTSQPSTVTVAVTARPDPATDPTVTAVVDAQVEATRGFARTQIANFMQRTETLHNGGTAGLQNGVRLQLRDLRPTLRTLPTDRDAEMALVDRIRGFGPAAALDGTGIGRVTGATEARGGRGRDAGAPRFPAAEDVDAGGRRIGSIGLWTGGSIELGTRDETSDRAKITISSGGLSGGADLRVAEGAVVGIGGGYGWNTNRIGGGEARVTGKNGVFAAYASVQPMDGTFIDGVIARGTLDYRTRRNVTATGTTALGSRDGDMTFGALSFGVDRTDGGIRWSLYGRGEWLDATLKGYAESGADRFNLRFDPRDVRSLTGSLGGRIEFTQRTGFGSVTPRLRAELQHEFHGSSAQGLDYADYTGTSFYNIYPQNWDSDRYRISVGNRLALPGAWTIDAELGLNASENMRSGQLRIEISKQF